MAEIILPPEEETPETPQVPELNIDKPNENSKIITIEFEAKKTNKVSTKDTNQQLYTTDTDAWFEFKETTLENANGTYSVVFRNRHDGSIFQRTGDVVNGVAYYKIPHQEIRHAGAWRGQIVYTLSNGDTTSREFGYDVKGHMLDGKDVREIIVEDFETLMSQLRSMKDNAEVELANLVNTANQNETNRQAFFDDLVNDIELLQTNYQELLDTGVLQTNINTKLEALEEEYAPKLTEVTAQLAQKAKQTDLELTNSKQSIIEKNLSEKRDKGTKIKGEDLDTSSDSVKIKPKNISDELMEMFSPAGEVSPVIPDGGVGTTKYADNSFIRKKTKTSLGSMQDGIYFSFPPSSTNMITKEETSLRIKFPHGTRAYYTNIEKQYVISLTELEYLLPHNYSLVYTIGDIDKFHMKNTNLIGRDDIILVTNHNGYDKINNIDEFKPQFNEIMYTSAQTSYEVDKATKAITVFFSGDKRMFIKRNVNLSSGLTVSIPKDSYTIAQNHALIFSTGSQEFEDRDWNHLLPDDIVLFGNYLGKLVQNNIGISGNEEVKRQYEDDIIHYAGTVNIENKGFDINVIFSPGDTRIFYKNIDGNQFIDLSNLIYVVKHNESLVLNTQTKTLESVNSNLIVRGKHLLLLTNHNGLPKKANIRIENKYDISEKHTVNSNEKREIFWDVPAAQGVAVIDNTLLSFNESRDDHSNFGKLYLIDKRTMELIDTVEHNLGHVNSCDYDPVGDRMIIGNNTGLGQEEPPAINIIYNAKQVFTETDKIDFYEIDKLTINLFTDDTELGDYGNRAKPNACWGEESNIIYLVMNDNKIIYRCFLGKGKHDLTLIEDSYGKTTWGEFMPEKEKEEYNGTLRILGTYPIKTSFGVNQGIEYYNGQIILSSSHDKILTLCYELKSDYTGELMQTYNHDIFDDMGSRVAFEPQGVCVDEGKLYQAFRNLDKTGFVVTPVD